MVADKEELSRSDIAKLCDISNSNVSNGGSGDKSFPATFEEASTAPIGNIENNECNESSKGNLRTKTVAVIGRARGGKSFFCSRFVKDRVGFQNLFCGNSSDKTVCPIYIKISEAVTDEKFVFHTDFKSVYHDDDSHKIVELRKKLSSLVDQNFGQNDIEKMVDIENITREMTNVMEQYPERKKCRTYIETYQKPSEFSQEVLQECELDSLQIIDTPGVSGNVEAARIAKSDLYVFLIKTDNIDEAQTIKNIVEQIKAEVAISKVAFLYKKEGIYKTQNKYDKARAVVKKDMLAYTELFSDLKGNIISTELDVLDPASHCIMFPTMDEEDIDFSEKSFLCDIKTKLLEAFVPENPEKLDEDFKALVEKTGDRAKEFTLNILRNIPCHRVDKNNKEYTEENFAAEGHNRVMTQDHYMLRNALDEAYDREVKLLDAYFSSFTADQYPEEWQQKIIKFIYKKLIKSVRTDRGLGVGTHPWEERPARTMLVEESIIASKILEGIRNKRGLCMKDSYIIALKNSNISSKSWNFVRCIYDLSAVEKLQIIKLCMEEVKVYSRQEMILFRYIGGLRKITQYNILRLIGLCKEEAMDQVKKLPF